MRTFARTAVRATLAAALPLLSFASIAAAETACRADLIELRGPFGTSRFTVEVVDTAASRAQGLMFREHLPSGAGMLFVYDRPQNVAFWMKNTLIPLDMIFMAEDGTVRRVHADAVPGDLTAIPGGEDIRFVLEINAGLAGAIGIAPGAQARHPAIPADRAAWPC
ncbi:DUF192 domain-containing protein [Pseudoruegeria aquimaris]|uniref:DUF192 domain-containing protein n=1 Tax=Pseudoruegeria aquimaris TaxID=393663 RepID=UPI001FE92039|nr:DUF192 domain-containing protein [Pseudoruegeria aquimaris]